MFESFGLFLGAFFDALIGPNLFVPAEPFLLAAGYQLYDGIISGVFMVLLGGFLGDQISYFAGRKFGKPAQQKLMKWQPKTRRAFARCRHLMATKGTAALMFSRLLGPVAWVVPFMAGTQKISWARFTIFSSIGLLLGAGQFIFWGFLLAAGVEQYPYIDAFITMLAEHKYSLIAVAATLVLAWVGYVYRWKKWLPKVSVFFLATMLTVNYSHYFWFADNFVDATPTSSVTPLSLNYKAYPGKSPIFDAQGVNVLFVGETPRTMMTSLGWIENQTFSRNDIDWNDYVGLLKGQTPPVSDLFWNGRPQDMAFQLPGDLLKRAHIRWWQAGVDERLNQPIWAGAISYDDGLTLTMYSGIITVLHSIDPNIDAERDKLASLINTELPEMTTAYYQAMPALAVDEDHDYYSDGRVLVLNDPQLVLTHQAH
ncbi:LssY C-terminal domain-containing protein [Enterovibrio sp. Hal110]